MNTIERHSSKFLISKFSDAIPILCCLGPVEQVFTLLLSWCPSRQPITELQLDQ